jgi:hypothetical protein
MCANIIPGPKVQGHHHSTTNGATPYHDQWCQRRTMTSGANILPRPIDSYSITDDFEFWVEAAKWASQGLDYKGKKLVQYREKKLKNYKRVLLLIVLVVLYFMLPCSHRADLPWKALERATCKSIPPFFDC